MRLMVVNNMFLLLTKLHLRLKYLKLYKSSKQGYCNPWLLRRHDNHLYSRQIYRGKSSNTICLGIR